MWQVRLDIINTHFLLHIINDLMPYGMYPLSEKKHIKKKQKNNILFHS